MAVTSAFLELMHIDIVPTILDAKPSSLDHITPIVLKSLSGLRDSGADRIGFVCGIISTDSRHKIPENLSHLELYTRLVSSHFVFPILSATSVFTMDILAYIEYERYEVLDWIKFWRHIHSSGFITDMIMTPRWEQSIGAKDEFRTAKEHGLSIYNVDPWTKSIMLLE